MTDKNHKWLGCEVDLYIENMIESDRQAVHALAGLKSPFKEIRSQHKDSIKKYTVLLEIYKKTKENVLQALADSCPSWDEWVSEGADLNAWTKLKERNIND